MTHHRLGQTSSFSDLTGSLGQQPKKEHAEGVEFKVSSIPFAFHRLALAPLVVHGASILRLSQSRRCRLGTGKPEVIRGDRLVKSQEPEPMENNDRTLKELATLDVGDMKCMFLEKFFPASKTTTIRKEVFGIRQHSRETMHEYWERFNKLCATCQHHQINKQLLIHYFYEVLTMMDRSMIDAASGGALMDKTPVATRHLISNMASNT
ncbi:hypothetical protein CR513_04344, partial [Mucuna pruriens]